MSCYLCSEKHISSVAMIVSQNPGMHLLLGSIFDQLVMDNVSSVKSRYPNSPDMWDGYDNYCLALVSVDLKTPKGKAQALKLLISYDYNACEADTWKKSDSFQWVSYAIEKLENIVNKETEAYKLASWDI